MIYTPPPSTLTDFNIVPLLNIAYLIAPASIQPSHFTSFFALSRTAMVIMYYDILYS